MVEDLSVQEREFCVKHILAPLFAPLQRNNVAAVLDVSPGCAAQGMGYEDRRDFVMPFVSFPPLSMTNAPRESEPSGLRSLNNHLPWYCHDNTLEASAQRLTGHRLSSNSRRMLNRTGRLGDLGRQTSGADHKKLVAWAWPRTPFAPWTVIIRQSCHEGCFLEAVVVRASSASGAPRLAL
jgi:hypothetical protein